MVQIRMALPVLISSKQAEFPVERADIVKIMEPMPLLAADAAEGWAPEAVDVQEKSVQRANACLIYVGLFGCIHSEPTILEYRAATRNPHREILVYIRDCDNREPQLSAFLSEVIAPVTGRTVLRYSDWRAVRKRFRDHLWEAIGRMAQHCLRLGSPPAAMGPGSALARRWERERAGLLELGLPATPSEALELATFLEAERSRLDTS